MLEEYAISKDIDPRFLENIQHVQDLCNTDGFYQSPVDLNIKEVQEIELPDLKWYHYNEPPSKMKLTNSAHTVILSAKWQCERPFITNGPLLGNYVFSQMHFHWGVSDREGSEHTVENISYPMELHVVHFKATYLTQEDALREKDGLLVVVYLFQLQEGQNYDLWPVTEALKYVTVAHSSTHVSPFPLEGFIKPFEKDYYLYWGCVNTLACAHRILWFVNREPIGISSSQVAKFRRLKGADGFPMRHNFHRVNPLKTRTIFIANKEEPFHKSLKPISPRPFVPVIRISSKFPRENKPENVLEYDEEDNIVASVPEKQVSEDNTVGVYPVMLNWAQSPFAKRDYSYHTQFSSKDNTCSKSLLISDLRLSKEDVIAMDIISQKSQDTLSPPQDLESGGKEKFSDSSVQCSGESENVLVTEQTCLNSSFLARRISALTRSAYDRNSDKCSKRVEITEMTNTLQNSFFNTELDENKSFLKSKSFKRDPKILGRESYGRPEEYHKSTMTESDSQETTASRVGKEHSHLHSLYTFSADTDEVQDLTKLFSLQVMSEGSEKMPTNKLELNNEGLRKTQDFLIFKVTPTSKPRGVSDKLKNIEYDPKEDETKIEEREKEVDSPSEVARNRILASQIDYWPFDNHEACSKLHCPMNLSKMTPKRILAPLTFVDLWSQRGKGYLANKGNTVEVTLEGHQAAVEGGPLSGTYKFAQLHFHWRTDEGSECDDEYKKLFAVESHAVFIHWTCNDVSEAKKTDNGVAVVGILLKVSSQENPDFNKITKHLKSISRPFSTTEISGDCLSWLKYLGPSGYYTYPGSQIVIVYPTPIGISIDQFEEFQRLSPVSTYCCLCCEEVSKIQGRDLYFATLE